MIGARPRAIGQRHGQNKNHREASVNVEYRDYLRILRYVSGALDQFLTDLFAGPLGETSVVVLLGDHGIESYIPGLRIE